MLRVPLGVVVIALVAGCGHGARKVERMRAPRAPQIQKLTKDPYEAAVAYVRCMRREGVPLPDPKRPDGDIQLTPADEKRIGGPGARTDSASEKCFHYLRGAVKTQPLSAGAKRRLLAVLDGFAACMRKRGWEFGKPTLTERTQGRVLMMFYGPSAAVTAAQAAHDPRLERDRIACERGQTARLDAAVGNER